MWAIQRPHSTIALPVKGVFECCAANPFNLERAIIPWNVACLVRYLVLLCFFLSSLVFLAIHAFAVLCSPGCCLILNALPRPIPTKIRTNDTWQLHSLPEQVHYSTTMTTTGEECRYQVPANCNDKWPPTPEPWTAKQNTKWRKPVMQCVCYAANIDHLTMPTEAVHSALYILFAVVWCI